MQSKKWVQGCGVIDMEQRPVARRRGMGMLALGVLVPLLWTVMLHAVLLPWPAEQAQQLVQLRTAQRVASAELLPPPPAQAAAAGALPSVTLPLYEPAPRHVKPAPYWLRMRFDLQVPASQTWLLELNHRVPVLVYLDHRLLAHSVPLDMINLPPENLQLGATRLAVNVPPDWLGAGAHVLDVRVGLPGPAGTRIGVPRLGPEPAMQEADFNRRAWLALRTLTTVVSLVVAVFLFSAWLVDRRERLVPLAALHVVLLAYLLSPYVLAEPLLSAPWWRLSLDVADVAAKAMLLAVVGAWALPSVRWVQRLALAYALVGIPIDALAALASQPWLDFSHPWPWWALGSRLGVLALAVGVAAAGWQAHGGAQRFVTLVLTGFSLWIWADVSFFALVAPGRVPVVDMNVLAYAGWALWVGALLHHRVLHTRRREEQLRQELAQQLAQRSEELKRQFDALQASERARMAAQERERLLQEMHDGLGAQLTSAKMLALDPNYSREELVRALEDCVRELRLAVDALSVSNGDLGLLLGSLRHRLEPGLRAAGIALRWRVADAPPLAALQGSQARELARIVQEAFSNIVHHAMATSVVIETHTLHQKGCVLLVIEDDGLGMGAEPTAGRGLSNMRQRAQRLGAEIEWLPGSQGRGTRLEVRLPLQPA